jgi:UDP-N-acetylmuramoyl-L-alanyl-D-glutamate--2,6-diaminopimelate ligase
MSSIESLARLLDGLCSVDSAVCVSGLTNDSRSVQPGYLFMAAVDGRFYIADAISRGAVAVVYDDQDGFECSSTDKVRAYPIAQLSQYQGIIASRFYQAPSRALSCVAVTGTNGKTSCTQWIAQALNQFGISCGVVGTLGAGFPSDLKPTGYTTPDAVLLQAELARLQRLGAKAMAIEVSSHALSQHRVNGMCFDVAVFTQLSQDHLDYHGDMARYSQEKMKLFESPGLKSAVINIDDPYGEKWAKKFSQQYPVMTYSLVADSTALIKPVSIECQSAGFLVEVITPWGQGSFHSRFMGRFNISNLLAVLGVLGHFDIPLKKALAILSSLQAIPGRMEPFGGRGQPSVIVDYCHTPDALKNALIALQSHSVGQLWCVFGCGGDRDRSKRAEMASIAEAYSDNVVLTQDNPRTESSAQIVNDIITGFMKADAVILESDRAAAIDLAVQKAGVDDTILVAGKGHEDYQIIGEEARPLSDRQQVINSLAKRT